MIATSTGLGFLIYNASNFHQTDAILVGIVTIGILCFLPTAGTTADRAMDGGRWGLVPRTGERFGVSRLVLLRHRSVVSLLLVAIAWGGWQLFLSVTAHNGSTRAPGGAPRRGAGGGCRHARLRPENFHIACFQSYGVVNGVRGTPCS